MSKRKHSELQQECVICLDEHDDDRIQSCAKCRNKICTGCLIKLRSSWVNRGLLLCPTCKRPFSLISEENVNWCYLALKNIEYLFETMDVGKVKTLHLKGNLLQDIPSGTFKGFTNLSKLVLCENWFESLNDSFLGLENLLELHFNYNKYNVVLSPNLFAPLSHLTSLDLCGSVRDLQVGVFNGLKQLTDLQLCFNHMTEVPNGLFDDLVNLKSLNLSHNRLRHIPVGLFKNLTQLEKLNLNSNCIENITPGAFTGLTTLEVLNLNHCYLTVVSPNALDDMTALHILNCVGNRLAIIPDKIFSKLSNLESLDLSSNDSLLIQDGLFDNNLSLTNLNLRNNLINTLPNGIFKSLSDLKYLNIGHNKLEFVDFEGLVNLETLSLNNNNIRDIRTMLKDLRNLKFLNLVKNAIQKVEAGDFVGLSSLETLLLSSNPLESFDAKVLSDCHLLKRLELKDTGLRELENPKTLHKMNEILVPDDFDKNQLRLFRSLCRTNKKF